MLGWLFWPIEPTIRSGLAELHHAFGWPETMYPHWKHIFVLLGLYFFREVWVGLAYGVGYSIFNFLLGLFVALTASVLAGTIPPTSADSKMQFLFATTLVMGAAVYGLLGLSWDATFLRDRWAKLRNKPMPSWWGYLKWGMWRVLSRTSIALVLAWTVLQIPFVQQLPSPGVVVSILLITAFAIYWLCDGVSDSKNMRREDESRLAAYWRSLHTQLGLTIAGPMFWCLVFIGMRAGNLL
jgi:hypothetical protein